MGRLQSTQTIALDVFCSIDNLISAHSIGNPVKYTYTSDIDNSIHSTNDHFVLSSELSGCINKHCVLDDLENRSDHVPLCLELSLPIDVNLCNQARQFEPKPKWQSATPVMISNYKQKLDQLLSIINVPADIISCYDLKCNTHTTFIECFYNDIVYAMINAAKDSIPYTNPYSKHCPSRPGWNDYVKSFQSEALDWHSIWISCGRPESGFVHDMRCATRKAYHKQTDFVIKREQQLKAEKLAASYVNSRSSDFWGQLTKIRGTGKNPSSSVNGISDNKGVANLFTDYYCSDCTFNHCNHTPVYN